MKDLRRQNISLNQYVVVISSKIRTGIRLPKTRRSALIFTNYKKQLDLNKNPGLYKFSDWLPIEKVLKGSGAPVTYKVKV